MDDVIFFDTETTSDGSKLLDIGAIKAGSVFHENSLSKFREFIGNKKYLCGHNIIEHDLKYVQDAIKYQNDSFIFIDTLYVSPLLFPTRPYHKLLKDEQLTKDELNNPVADSKKASELFYDEISNFFKLDYQLKGIYGYLLSKDPHFTGFLSYVNTPKSNNICYDIKTFFHGLICENIDIQSLVNNYPIELAYALAIINAKDKKSLTPSWVYFQYPQIVHVINVLRNTPCYLCEYCRNAFNLQGYLKKYFKYDNFRKYNGEPLQEKTVKAAVEGKSLLAVFPTGGGKSLTFQLPALIAAETTKALTVVISPLQSLMKDQVDNLERKGIAEAVTINGLLSPLERSRAIERVLSGDASILYISPESLRSRTIEKLLLSRDIARFVIDEAHCFSSWGQDFRVDYLFIGDFIKRLCQKKKSIQTIPVSCFTATAKQKVINDIVSYFKGKLNLELELFTTNTSRKNLHYSVIHKGTDDEKYQNLRMLIESRNCPTIVYVSRTKRAVELAKRLKNDGFAALPFHGRMEPNVKIETQNAFIENEIQVIVATSAFGMGVDKSDVKLVVHYDISSSLEDYVQEAGRAGRNEKDEAECFVLFNNNDLDKHFTLLNQTRLTIDEVREIWRAIKFLTKDKKTISKTALEIARQAGWSEDGKELETRVRTALATLEYAGYIERGFNVPRVYATSIIRKSMIDSYQIIQNSPLLNEADKISSRRILSKLFTQKNINKPVNQDDSSISTETRVDYIADLLSMKVKDVIKYVNILRELNILADDKDLSARIKSSDSENKSLNILDRYIKIENFLLAELFAEQSMVSSINYKEINDKAIKSGIEYSTIKILKTIIYYWTINGLIEKEIDNQENRWIKLKVPYTEFESQIKKRNDIAKNVIRYLFLLSHENQKKQIVNWALRQDQKSTQTGGMEYSSDETPVMFSVLELKKNYNNEISLFHEDADYREIENALLYLLKIDSLKLDGGFLVTYAGMTIKRLVQDNKIQFKQNDYQMLKTFYQHKIQQIHIVGEYANLMIKNPNHALQFVNDYFELDYQAFIEKYFKGRWEYINRSITQEKYDEIYNKLSVEQSAIISDKDSKFIVVAAGPGSGKTRILVNKLASLVQLEDVKYEQLLMLTFSRTAALEFKKRLRELIGGAINFIDIKTFHSYCFDLLGKVGNLEDIDDVVGKVTEMIVNDEIEIESITKKVLVIDEAQDMDEKDFNLVKTIIDKNEDIRVILVGDDDQNIYEFRGSDSKYFESFINCENAKKYELLQNYRSSQNIVKFANGFLPSISNRLKTNPIFSTKDNNGFVRLVKYDHGSIEIPLIKDVVNSGLKKDIAILTGTNEEALRILGLLIKQGIKARLVQSNEGFRLVNLLEFRYLINYIKCCISSSVIDDDLWNRAINVLKNNFAQSDILQNCLLLLQNYAAAGTKYFSDLKEFILESNLSDYVDSDKEAIIVSTLHRSKGKEFDNVFILLDNYKLDTDAGRRAVYVGMTRAKNNLVIHYTGTKLDNYKDNADQFNIDNHEYEIPNEITLQFGFKDVYLNYFKGKVALYQKLRAGNLLEVDDNCLFADISGKRTKVAMFSKKAIDDILKLKEKGYVVKNAKIRFLVYWQGQDDEQESLVLLPDINFIKK